MRQFLLETRQFLHQMIRTINIKEEVCVRLFLVCPHVTYLVQALRISYKGTGAWGIWAEIFFVSDILGDLNSRLSGKNKG